MVPNLPQLETPRVVCLCGSTKYMGLFDAVNRDFTLAGFIVVSVGVDMKFRDADYLNGTKSHAQREEIKVRLDKLHKQKIRMAAEVFILNYDGQVGTSTWDEVLLAYDLGKPVEWLEPDNIPDGLKHCVRPRSTLS